MKLPGWARRRSFFGSGGPRGRARRAPRPPPARRRRASAQQNGANRAVVLVFLTVEKRLPYVEKRGFLCESQAEYLLPASFNSSPKMGPNSKIGNFGRSESTCARKEGKKADVANKKRQQLF